MGLACWLAYRKLKCQLLLLLFLLSPCYYYHHVIIITIWLEKYYSVLLWHLQSEGREQQMGQSTGSWLLKLGARSR